MTVAAPGDGLMFEVSNGQYLDLWRGRELQTSLCLFTGHGHTVMPVSPNPAIYTY